MRNFEKTKDNYVSDDLRQSRFQVSKGNSSLSGRSSPSLRPCDWASYSRGPLLLSSVPALPTGQGVYGQRKWPPRAHNSLCRLCSGYPRNSLHKYPESTSRIFQGPFPSLSSQGWALPAACPLHLRDGCLQGMQMESGHVDQDVHTHIHKVHIFSAHR